MKNSFVSSRSLCVAALAVTSVLRVAAGDFDVTVDTSSLIGNASAPFSLDFQLNDGAGTGSAQNWAGISSFNYGTGSATGTPTSFGGAAGDIASGLTLNTTSAFNELYQGFTPGSTLTFHLSLSDVAPSTSTPDSFSFAILDKNLGNLATTGLADTLFQVDITSTGEIFTSGSALAGAVTITATPVPEPYAASVVALGLLGAFAVARRVKAAKRA